MPDAGMTNYFNDPTLLNARVAAQAGQNAYNEAVKASYTLPDMLKEALSKKLTADNPVVANRESALTKYFDVAGKAPLSVTPKSAGGLSDYVYNPAQQQALISALRGTALAPVSSANLLYGTEVGGMGDVIDSTGRAYQGVTTGLQAKAAELRQFYNDVFAEAQAKQEAADKAAAAAEDKRRWELTYALDKLKANKTGSGDYSFSNVPSQEIPSYFTPDAPATVQPYISPELMKFRV